MTLHTGAATHREVYQALWGQKPDGPALALFAALEWRLVAYEAGEPEPMTADQFGELQDAAPAAALVVEAMGTALDRALSTGHEVAYNDTRSARALVS